METGDRVKVKSGVNKDRQGLVLSVSEREDCATGDVVQQVVVLFDGGTTTILSNRVLKTIN